MGPDRLIRAPHPGTAHPARHAVPAAPDPEGPSCAAGAVSENTGRNGVREMAYQHQSPPPGEGTWRPATNRAQETTPPDDEGSVPNIADLTERLRFSLRDGHIWFDTQRVALIHVSTLAWLRRELIHKLGVPEAKVLMARMGYASGCRDAILARKLRPHRSIEDALLVGPQLRALQGIISVQPGKLDADIAGGHFSGDLTFTGSFEADAQIAHAGLTGEPTCWMQAGYASGYVSTFMGRRVLFKEIECHATGSQCCRMIGKPIEDWEVVEEEWKDLQGDAAAGGGSRPHEPQQAPGAAPDTRLPECGDRNFIEGVVGVSSGFVAACRMLQKAAGTNATVLLLGETGVGKEMFARMLHGMSRRADKPFVAVNCAAIPETLIEAELFGVEKGAYTGATQSRAGRFERADCGTLFLDEIGTLTMAAQIKLLRAIQAREIERIGDTGTRHVDVRIVAATNVDLKSEAKAGTFREDLLYRINVFPVRVPPLRERRDDIPLLMEHFLQRYARCHERSVSGFTARAVDALYEYEYPGNIRELENLVERAVILADDAGLIDINHLFAPEDLQSSMVFKLDAKGGLQQGADDPAHTAARFTDVFDAMVADGLSLEAIECELMRRAVDRSNGKVARAARLLGMTRPQLAYRLKKLDGDHPE